MFVFSKSSIQSFISDLITIAIIPKEYSEKHKDFSINNKT